MKLVKYLLKYFHYCKKLSKTNRTVEYVSICVIVIQSILFQALLPMAYYTENGIWCKDH